MAYDPAIHHRRSIRLRGHDYGGGGAYFITSCVSGGDCLFGQMVEGEMVVSGLGHVVVDTWLQLASRFPAIILDAQQVMPNHFHGIIVIPGPGLDEPLAKPVGAPVIHPYRDAGPRLVLRPDVGPRLASARPAALQPRPTQASDLRPRRVTLPAVVGAFKSLSAIAVNRVAGRSGRRLWQEDYYEHIVRGVAELERIRDYIIHNPVRWHEDPENPNLSGQGLPRAPR